MGNKRLFKRLSFILALMMVFMSLNVPVLAETAPEVEAAAGEAGEVLGEQAEYKDPYTGLTFTVDNSIATITGYDGGLWENPVIPEKVYDDDDNEYTVGKIKENAFEQGLMDYTIIFGYLVIFGDPMICKEAFKGCKGLSGICIAGSGTLIDQTAFDGCRWVDKVTNYSNSYIYPNRIRECTWLDEDGDVITGTLKNGSAIKENAIIEKCTVSFDSMGGSDVATQEYDMYEITKKPNAPTWTGHKFIDWYTEEQLTNVYSFGLPIYESVRLYAKWEENSESGDVFLDKDTKFQFTVNADNNTATITGYKKDELIVEGFNDNLGDLNIPGTVTNRKNTEETYTVTGIADKAFDGDLRFTGTLTIPDSVTTIGSEAFADLHTTGDIKIPDKVTKIGDKAFEASDSFDGKLTIGSSVTTIGSRAFNGCTKLTGGITIPDSVTSIGDSAFFNCGGFNGELKLGKGLQNIGANAFDPSLSNGGKSLLTGVLTIPESVTSIGDKAFYNCEKLTGPFTLGKSVKTIGEMAFYGCKGLTGALYIPESVETIESDAFQGCSGLTGTLTIAGTDTRFDGSNEVSSSFYLCTGITRVVNNTDNELNLTMISDDGKTKHTWTDATTGETVINLKKGIAVRDDYTGEPVEISANEASDFKPEERAEGDYTFTIKYFHKISFYGKAKLKPVNFVSADTVLIVSSNEMEYEVSKIKIKKKKNATTGTIQITGLKWNGNKDKRLLKALKKATKGINGLPFEVEAFNVNACSADDVKVKINRKGKAKYFKVRILNKWYKAKKNVDYDYDETTGVFTFKGDNLKGTWTVPLA